MAVNHGLDQPRWKKKIEAFQLRCFRKIIKVSYTEHRTNVSIGAEIEAAIVRHEHLLSTMRRRKMRWFGHINRSHGLANTIVQGALERVRRRGMLRSSWLGNIVKWTGKTAREIHTTSLNRKEWRDIIFSSSHVRFRQWIGNTVIQSWNTNSSEGDSCVGSELPILLRSIWSQRGVDNHFCAFLYIWI